MFEVVENRLKLRKLIVVSRIMLLAGMTSLPIYPLQPSAAQVKAEILNSDQFKAKKAEFEAERLRLANGIVTLTATQMQIRDCGLQFNRCQGSGGSLEGCATSMNACIDSVSGAGAIPQAAPTE